MEGRQELVILILWCIALGATILVVKEKGVFTYLTPLFGICMIGSVIAIRNGKIK